MRIVWNGGDKLDDKTLTSGFDDWDGEAIFVELILMGFST